MLNDHCHRVSTHLQSINIIIIIIIIIVPRVNHALGVSESHLVTIVTSVYVVSVRSAYVERIIQRSEVTGQQR